MGEQQLYYLPPPPLPTPQAPPALPPAPPSSHEEVPPPSSSHGEPPPPPRRFDPSRMVGIIRRKALIKDLAAVYHAECLAYCQELLELQIKLEEFLVDTSREAKYIRTKDKKSYTDLKIPENSKKETMRPPKRLKKSR